jgi:hypothetical protein
VAEPAISISVIWLDNDMIELRVAASGPGFSAQVDFYESFASLAQFAVALRGFPAQSSESRRFGLGNWHGATSGAGVEFRFSADARGHVSIVADFETDQALPEDIPPKVAFLLTAEPAGIDRFCSQLEAMRREKGAHAELPAV